MSVYLFPALLQVLGIFVIIAEIFIPSLGLLSVIAVAIFGYSLYLVFTTISTTAGIVVTGIDLVVVPIIIYAGIRMLGESSLSLKSELSASEGVASQKKEMETCLGMEGEAVTDLRPAGMAVIGQNRLDVVTDGEYVDAGTRVAVVRVTGNQIIVEKTNN
ncbi:MAG: serine protease [Desulfobacterales bacterium]|nr:serine protease [Desulfobacterales bacterium]